MKMPLKYKLVLVLLISITSVSAQGTIDEVVGSYMSTHRIPGLSLAIVQDDSITTLKAYGVASLQQNAKVEVTTTFELASLTKQFTAAAILHLQQEGRLKVDDPLHRYFPECPEQWNAITIEQLLWHTSGLPGLFPHDDFTHGSFTGYAHIPAAELDAMMQTNTISKEVAIRSIVTDTLDTKPGTTFNYSDVGFQLLGIVIDNITGNYKDHLSAIFERFDLRNTYFVDQEKVVRDQARGYSLKDGEWINIMRTWDHEVPSHFGVFSNVQDLAKWYTVLSGTDFLNEESRKFMFTKGKVANNEEVPYGCGWEINDLNGLRFISHTGVTGTILVSLPERYTTVIVLSNLGYNGNDMVSPFGLAYEVMDHLGIGTRVNRGHITSGGLRQIRTTTASFQNLTGTYVTADNTEARIHVNDGQAYVELQGSTHELSLLENGSWLVLGLDHEYILTLDDAGQRLTSNYGRIFTKK